MPRTKRQHYRRYLTQAKKHIDIAGKNVYQVELVSREHPDPRMSAALHITRKLLVTAQETIESVEKIIQGEGPKPLPPG